MTLAHNMFIRGLNSIYLQAPHIAAAEHHNFAQYMRRWSTIVRLHYQAEEVDFFTAIEALSGVESIMEGNIAQHHAFEPGLDAFHAHVEAVLAGTEDVLVAHLADGIPTLEGLRPHADKLEPFVEEGHGRGGAELDELGLSGMVWAFAHIDLEFGDGMWANWPAASAVVRFLATSLFWRIHGGMAKFKAVDKSGHMRHLYAVLK
ncbi:hypothetical protein B0H67DRAFT_680162 [Lasiosphaeris hirsuta]|uniref:Hemerythrin-like domain-containing protein n=1 Tax=Lasiosphaeris hirsuta TaxID=260670 RepID=A0AA40E1L9_9PEZI|nr:hypothetical protein B0H67DRAFT_680162 [Lasiosphaeris hirsuta]